MKRLENGAERFRGRVLDTVTMSIPYQQQTPDPIRGKDGKQGVAGNARSGRQRRVQGSDVAVQKVRQGVVGTEPRHQVLLLRQRGQTALDPGCVQGAVGSGPLRSAPGRSAGAGLRSRCPDSDRRVTAGPFPVPTESSRRRICGERSGGVRHTGCRSTPPEVAPCLRAPADIRCRRCAAPAFRGPVSRRGRATLPSPAPGGRGKNPSLAWAAGAASEITCSGRSE